MKRLLIVMILTQLACMTSAAASNIAPKEERSNPAVAATATTAPQVVTICGDVNVREGPAAVGPVLGWLHDGKTVKVYEQRGAWARIDGGWVVILCKP